MHRILGKIAAGITDKSAFGDTSTLADIILVNTQTPEMTPMHNWESKTILCGTGERC